MSSIKLSKDEQLIYLHLYRLELDNEDINLTYPFYDIADSIMSSCDISYMEVLENITSLVDKGLLLSKVIDDKTHYMIKRPARESHIKEGREVSYRFMTS